MIITLNKSKKNLAKVAKGLNVSIKGIDELMLALKNLGDDGILIGKEASKTASKTMHKYVMEEASTAFKDSGNLNHAPGNLRRKITAKSPKQNKTKTQIYASVGFSKGAAYGVNVEYGHKKVLWVKKTSQKVEARPFLRPAFDKHVGEIFNSMLAEIWKKVADIWERGAK